MNFSQKMYIDRIAYQRELLRLSRNSQKWFQSTHELLNKIRINKATNYKFSTHHSFIVFKKKKI